MVKVFFSYRPFRKNKDLNLINYLIIINYSNVIIYRKILVIKLPRTNSS